MRAASESSHEPSLVNGGEWTKRNELICSAKTNGEAEWVLCSGSTAALLLSKEGKREGGSGLIHCVSLRQNASVSFSG